MMLNLLGGLLGSGGFDQFQGARNVLPQLEGMDPIALAMQADQARLDPRMAAVTPYPLAYDTSGAMNLGFDPYNNAVPSLTQDQGLDPTGFLGLASMMGQEQPRQTMQIPSAGVAGKWTPKPMTPIPSARLLKRRS